MFPVKYGYMSDSKGISVKSGKLVGSLENFWIHANPFTELGATGFLGASTTWGSPSSNSVAYSQLDEMPHMLLVNINL